MSDPHDYDIDIALNDDTAVHIHQQDCFVPVIHRRHMITIGVYEGVAYYYQCLGRIEQQKSWKREKRP